MKKNYVKPVMECELFVANEYVAACWSIVCLGIDDYNGFAKNTEYRGYYTETEFKGNFISGGAGLTHESHGALLSGFESPDEAWASLADKDIYIPTDLNSRNSHNSTSKKKPVKTYDGHLDCTVEQRPNASL